MTDVTEIKEEPLCLERTLKGIKCESEEPHRDLQHKMVTKHEDDQKMEIKKEPWYPETPNGIKSNWQHGQVFVSKLSSVTANTEIEIKVEPLFEDEASIESDIAPDLLQKTDPQMMVEDEVLESPRLNITGLEMKTKHSTRQWRCEICEKSFTSMSTLRRHYYIHVGKKEHTCEICCKSFISKSGLKSHMIRHEPNKPFKCACCDKGFTQKSALEKHGLTHEGIRPHACPICNKTFTEKSTMKRHVATHNGNKPYKCEICDRNFPRKSNLGTHILTIHEGKKPFKCEICGKSFPRKASLSAHMCIHEGTRPQQCATCGKCFYDKSGLKKHTVRHNHNKEHAIKAD